MLLKVAAMATAFALAVSVAGCGLGAGKGTSDVAVTVTRDFGSTSVGSVSEGRVPGSQTVMRLLERSYRVTTRYGGGFVESIDGLSGNSSRRDWFYYVNGIEASQGAAGTAVHKGDRVWWDLHDWSATDSIPAVVGSFPEPFVHGLGGRRYPTTLECAGDATAACQKVSSQLDAIGVKVASQALGAGGSGTDSIAVVVGTWRDVRGEFAASEIENGPGSSGIYAKFAAGGATLDLLGPHAQVVRTLGAGAGLIAATAANSSAPVWLVTGTNLTGVMAAADALTQARLRNHFALAVQGQTDLALPLEPGT
jgi:hypothetical protein